METVGSPCSTFETVRRVTVARSAMSCMDKCLRLRANMICSPIIFRFWLNALGIVLPNVFFPIIVSY